MNYLSQFNVLFNPVLENFFLQKEKEIKKSSPIVKKSVDKIKAITLSGGKRLRPALVYYAFKGFGGNSFAKIKSYCLSIEILHSWALIHDDVMDKAKLRRGQKTIHESLGQNMAILCGDLAFAWAADLYTQNSPGSRLNKLFSLLTSEVIYGQMMDINKALNEKEVIKLMLYKTAGYSIEKPLLLGAVVAGAKEKKLKDLGSFGKNVGLSFQIQDDILGIFGSENLLGKPVDSDLKEGKTNLLFLKTLKKLNSKDKKEFISIWGNPASSLNNLHKARRLIQKSGGLDECISLYNYYQKQANSILLKNSLPQSLKKVLLDLTKEFLILNRPGMISPAYPTKL